MPYGFNDDRSKNDLSEFASVGDLLDYVPKDELKGYVLGLLKEGTHDNIIASDGPITVSANSSVYLIRNFGTLDGRRAISFNGIDVLDRASNGNVFRLPLIPIIRKAYTDSDNVCHMEIELKNVVNTSLTTNLIRLYYTYIDL